MLNDKRLEEIRCDMDQGEPWDGVPPEMEELVAEIKRLKTVEKGG